MENQIENKNLISNKKQWIFITLILATIIVPQIIANQYNTEFVFGYPVGEEYRIVKAIAALIGMFLVGNFIQQFHLNKSLKIFLSIISLIPIARLMTATALFFLWKRKDHNAKNKISLKERGRDIVLLVIGGLVVYNFILAITGFLFFGMTDLSIKNIFSILISILFFYAIYKRNIYLVQIDLIIYISIFIIMYFIF